MKLNWKHNYGDNEPTYDWVLWINGKPTQHCISQTSGIFYCYIDDTQKYMAESLKEAKEFICDELGL